MKQLIVSVSMYYLMYLPYSCQVRASKSDKNDMITKEEKAAIN
jgi:hypothetical protein